MISRAPRARRVASVVTALALGLWVAIVGIIGAAATRAPTGAVVPAAAHRPVPQVPQVPSEAAATAQAALSVRVERVDPIIAVPGTDVRLVARLTNTGSEPTAGQVQVGVQLGAASDLRTRTQIRRFAADGELRRGTRVIAAATTPGPMAPGATAQLQLTIPGDSINPDRPYGALPMRLRAQVQQPAGASGGEAVSTVRASFLPFHARKEYQPLATSVVVPLTLDPDPTLVTATGQDRANAWAQALEPGGRIDRVLAATSQHRVTYAVDPALLDTPDYSTGTASPAESPTTSPTPPATPTAASSPTSPSTPTPTQSPAPDPTSPATPDPAEPAQQALRTRLAQLARDHGIWALPRNDPDLSALVAADATQTTVDRALGEASDVPDLLGLPGAARVAWPVGRPLSTAAGERVRKAFASGGAGGAAATIAPASAYDADPDASGTAVRRAADGTPVITFDDELSRLLMTASDPEETTELTLQVLAETGALVAQAPGRHRSVVIAAGREFSPSPPAVQGLLTALAGTPWIQLTGTDGLLDAGAAQDTVGSPQAGVTDPTSAGPSPVTTAALTRIESQYGQVAGLSSVLSARSDSLVVPDEEALDTLLSSRWRAAPRVWTDLEVLLRERVAALETGVSVVPSTINFFADSGVLQVTVVNRLDVDVRDVRVVFEPGGRPPRLRVVEEPAPLTIRAGSRTTVRVQVEAIAAGVVPVSTHLATPANTRLGSDATVRVRVQPTNGWLMLGLGGLAGVVFIAGLFRALRVGRPRVPTEDLKEIDHE